MTLSRLSGGQLPHGSWVYTTPEHVLAILSLMGVARESETLSPTSHTIALLSGQAWRSNSIPCQQAALHGLQCESGDIESHTSATGGTDCPPVNVRHADVIKHDSVTEAPASLVKSPEFRQHPVSCVCSKKLFRTRLPNRNAVTGRKFAVSSHHVATNSVTCKSPSPSAWTHHTPPATCLENAS